MATAEQVKQAIIEGFSPLKISSTQFATTDEAVSGTDGSKIISPVALKSVLNGRLGGYLPTSGGVLTGALDMSANNIKNANYVYANWYAINSNIASSTAAKEVLVKQGGWIYSRTPAQLLGDMGVSYGTEDLTAGTSALATGSLYFVYE